MNYKRITLGPEYDAHLRSTLKNVLVELGAALSSSEWGVVGSQELEQLEVEVGGSKLAVEAETYVGLSILGEPSLVDHIAQLVRARLVRRV